MGVRRIDKVRYLKLRRSGEQCLKRCAPHPVKLLNREEQGLLEAVAGKITQAIELIACLLELGADGLLREPPVLRRLKRGLAINCGLTAVKAEHSLKRLAPGCKHFGVKESWNRLQFRKLLGQGLKPGRLGQECHNLPLKNLAVEQVLYHHVIESFPQYLLHYGTAYKAVLRGVDAYPAPLFYIYTVQLDSKLLPVCRVRNHCASLHHGLIQRGFNEHIRADAAVEVAG